MISQSSRYKKNLTDLSVYSGQKGSKAREIQGAGNKDNFVAYSGQKETKVETSHSTNLKT
jgi:hypothetical protein